MKKRCTCLRKLGSHWSRHGMAVLLILLLCLAAHQVFHLSWSLVSSTPQWSHGGKLSSRCSPLDQRSPLVHLAMNRNESHNESWVYNYGPYIQWSLGRFDNSRKIRIYEWVWRAELWQELTDTQDLCLATQSSVDRLHWIAEVSEKWTGAISVAVYLTSVGEWTTLLLFMEYMRRCSLLFGQSVSMSIAVPATFVAPHSSEDVWSYTLDKFPCGQAKTTLKSLMTTWIPRSLPAHLYPQNHMRNVARKSCGTNWVFMTDVDIIPRQNSSVLLHQFLQTKEAKECVKCGFVVPTFELEVNTKFPESKSELVNLYKRNLARPFHFKIYRNGHWATNYSLWSSSYPEESEVKISHKVESRMSHYEPFYVSSDAIPPHDERFIGYGFTRSSQVLEARVWGWRFWVLTPIFTIHWGLQTPSSIQASSLRGGINAHKGPSRKTQNAHNQILYTDFLSELTARHNISNERKKADAKKKSKVRLNGKTRPKG